MISVLLLGEWADLEALLVPACRVVKPCLTDTDPLYAARLALSRLPDAAVAASSPWGATALTLAEIHPTRGLLLAPGALEGGGRAMRRAMRNLFAVAAPVWAMDTYDPRRAADYLLAL